MAPGGTVIRKTGAFHHRPKVFKRYPSVDRGKSALNDVLEFGSIQDAGTAQSEEVSPGFRGKSTALVRSHNAKCHL